MLWTTFKRLGSGRRDDEDAPVAVELWWRPPSEFSQVREAVTSRVAAV